MILINNKDFNSLQEQTITKMQENGFSVTPGAIAKLFADILNKNISDFYEVLTLNHIQSFVTTSTGKFLDAIGILLNCTRLTGEVDSDFRKRITHQCLTLANANETAIRLAALSVNGVEDVAMRRYSHGPGSFTVVPIIANNDTTVLTSVKEAILKVSSYGEKITIKMPDYKLTKISISLIYSTNTSDVEKQNIAVSVREEIIKYINSLKTGESLIINELTQRIMQVDDNIINYSCGSFKINNENTLFINQGSRWDERFAISPDENAITVI